MNEFALNLIKNKSIAFRGGSFLFFGIPMHFITMPNIITFFNIVEDKFEGATEIIKQCAKKQVLSISGKIIGKADTPDKIEYLLKCLNLLGYGKFEIMFIDNKNKKVNFKVNSQFCKVNSRLFGHSDSAFIEGICAGIAEIILNDSMVAIHKCCIGKYSEHCHIDTGQKKTRDCMENYKSNIYTTLKQQPLDDKVANLIINVHGQNMLDWKNGKFTLWASTICLIPTLSLIFMTNELSKISKDVFRVWYHTARVQSREAVNLQVNKLGFKRNKDLILSVLEHSDISGFGTSKVENSDFDKKILSFKQYSNPYPFYLRQIFGKQQKGVDFYMAGLAAGAAEGFFQCKMMAEEFECTAKGSDYCFHKAVPAKKESDEDFVSIIEEKITCNNFFI